MQLVVIKPVNHLWYYVTYKLHTCIVNLFYFYFISAFVWLNVKEKPSTIFILEN